MWKTEEGGNKSANSEAENDFLPPLSVGGEVAVLQYFIYPPPPQGGSMVEPGRNELQNSRLEAF